MMPALVCLALPLLSGCTAYTEAVPTPAVLSSHRAQYDGIDVRVTGKVRDLEQWTFPQSGQSFTVFQLCDDACVRVFIPERAQVRNGEPVTVRGLYRAHQRSGRRVYENEIEAAEIAPQS